MHGGKRDSQSMRKTLLLKNINKCAIIQAKGAKTFYYYIQSCKQKMKKNILLARAII